MGLEQRGRVRWSHDQSNWKQEDLDACDRQAVQHRQEAGVRSVSSGPIQWRGGWRGRSDHRAVRGRLEEQPLQDLEQNELGNLLSAAGARRPHSQKVWGPKDFGCATVADRVAQMVVKQVIES